MNDITGLLLMIALLAVYLIIFRKKIKNWDELSSMQKSLFLRPIIIWGAGIILLIYQKIKSH